MTGSEPLRRRLGRYELIAEVASGGMGIVCLARSVGVGGFRRLFAIKVMHPHLVRDPQFIAMLLDEAQLAARIHHPNVVATVDICTVDDCYFVVMDYVDGFQLLQLLEHPHLGRHDRMRVANRILLDAMAGLEAAHSLRSDDGAPLGLVHRDVSPHNILVGIDGIGRLTDFGIALAESRISSSRPGTIKGKPSYMAPEQARAAHVDRRADVWALGVILWEALSGQRLFVGDTEAATVLKVIEAPIAPPREFAPDVPPPLEAVCLRALERDPGRRFASARQMAAALERAAGAHGLLADSHEVADTLQQLFAEEIEKRRVAIRSYAALLGPNSAAIGPRDIYELPQLEAALPDGVVALSPLPHTPPTVPTRLSAGSSPQPAAQDESASAATVAGPNPYTPPVANPQTLGSARTTMGSSSEVAETKSGRSRGVLLAATLAVLGGSVFWLGASNEAEADEGAAAPAPSQLAVPEPEIPGPAAPPPGPAVVPVTSAAVEPEPVPVPSAAASAPAAAAPSSKESTVAPGPRRTPRSAPRTPARSTREQAPAPSSGPKSPVVEENPYRLR